MRCPSCNESLLREDWNSAVDILVCDNFMCKRFRQPITIEKNAPLEGSLDSLVEEAKTSHKERRRVENSFPSIPVLSSDAPFNIISTD